jgi:hypothetical protein
MNAPVLTLRITRRAIGAAVLAGENFTLMDGRHLTSRRERASVAAVRYIERLLDLSKAGRVVLDASQPTEVESGSLVSVVEAVLRDRQISSLIIGRADLLRAYGVRALRNRAALRALATSFWPELARYAGKVRPYVVDAAVAALYAESRLALNPPPT